jgi:hypothetical protein
MPLKMTSAELRITSVLLQNQGLMDGAQKDLQLREQQSL